MKVGETVPVNIGAGVVAQAKITGVDTENSTVTMEIPATRVVMGYKVQLETAPPVAEPEGAHSVITGVDRVDAEGNVIGAETRDVPSESAAQGVENPPAEEVTDVVSSVDSDSDATPTGEATQTQLVEPAPVVETNEE